ncbi:MAG TPA: hypothetical protein VEK55_14595 [Xanthobacteraceae bacterium]|nr:hypothetical protein [Xanthobacteraceae bacterium]
MSRPECLSLLDLRSFAEEEKLNADDAAALATLKSMAAAAHSVTGASNRTPPTIFNLNSLFLAINPGLRENEEFGTRTLLVTTRIDGVTYSAKHQVRSPRYEFGFTAYRMVNTFLTFYGEGNFVIHASAPMRGESGKEEISFQVGPASAPCDR